VQAEIITFVLPINYNWLPSTEMKFYCFLDCQSGPSIPLSRKVLRANFAGIKQLGHGADHSSPSRAKFMKYVELYFQSAIHL
jgi:hypothetical protein